MPEIQEVAEKTFRLEAPLPQVNNIFSVYLIQEGGGVLIEPGPAATTPHIQEGMKKLGMKGLAYVIPTHIHLDHGGGVGRLASLFPQAQVVLHPQGVRHMIDPARLIESTKMAFGPDWEQHYGPILPVPQAQVKTPQDGEVIPVDGRRLQIIYSPGHAPHHLSVLDQKTGGLFCGEALGVPEYGVDSPPLPYAAPPGFDLEVYLETMDKLRALKPKILFYSHGGVGREPEKLIPLAKENARAFGEIILKGLKAGETPEAIASRVQDYMSQKFHFKPDKTDPVMTIAGYLFYFKKKQGLA